MVEKDILLIDIAISFATEAHGDQKRKYTGDPYITHPIAVSKIVQNVVQDVDLICTAILHDVIEDTATTYEDIESVFGTIIADLVLQVSDISKPADGNRKLRKSIDRKHLANASPGAMTVKLADILHNGYDIEKNDPSFARVYMREIEKLLPSLKHGNSELYKRAGDMLMNYYLKKTGTSK